jgi:predicted secreted protein
LHLLFGTDNASLSKEVRIEAPLQGTRGKGVPISVHAGLIDVEAIAIVTRNNARPLNCVVRLTGADAYYSAPIRIEQSSAVAAYIKTGANLYYASTDVKVSAGGYSI